MSLIINDVSVICRPEDLRIPFERFGPVKDVYLPKNYYTGYILLLPVTKLFFPTLIIGKD